MHDCLRATIICMFCMLTARMRQHRTEQDMGQSSSAAEADKGNRGLAELFKAPADLLHKGTIDDAYLAAKSKGRWLVWAT